MVQSNTIGSKIFDFFNVVLMLTLSVIFLYPMWFSLAASFSNPAELYIHTGVLLKPLGFSTLGYETVFKNQNVLIGYKNTLIYMVGGTALNILLTCIGAYILSRRHLMLKKFIMLMIIFTMHFSGGLIPSFLLVQSLGLYNTRWALILPGAIGTWNMIVMRTAFSRIPASLEESAMIDGANDWTILVRIILPVSKATIAVVALFYAVEHWNSWFSAAIYLRNRTKYPLQLFLREILIANANAGNTIDGIEYSEAQYLDEVLKYCMIIISTVPILCIYPYVQKYFMTGVMLGSVKE